MKRWASSLVVAALVLIGCTSVPDGLSPVEGFDQSRYLGKWYEIARLDHSFERNLSNVSATYTRKDNGDIRVYNRGFNAESQEWEEIEGNARFIGEETTGSLRVSFFGPFYGGYHIIELDRENYSYAMVTGPTRSYLWILARTAEMDTTLFSELVSKANGWGFDTSQLIKVQHDKNG